ncbi:MAG: non-heme iron oxygenase ferredoxin subunit [Chloroflexi bacterium]|nr:non-heme iron oxygenase ferredoxin subunit [Chloroflexota bacterium]
MAESGYVKVAEVGELSPGDMKTVEVGEEQILIVNINGNIHACDDVCSHAYASLSEGDLNGEEVECPLHGSAFNVTTGEVLTPPADENVRVFEVRIDGQDILVGPPKS